MGAIQLRDELRQEIHRAVARGYAECAEMFLEAAVERMLEGAEEAAFLAAIEEGLADADARRTTLIATPEDAELLLQRLTEDLHRNFAAGRVL
jgi:predicted transcriptional regulator